MPKLIEYCPITESDAIAFAQSQQPSDSCFKFKNIDDNKFYQVSIDTNGNPVVTPEDTVGSSSGGSDDWGNQVVVTDDTLTGDGTQQNPLSVVLQNDCQPILGVQQNNQPDTTNIVIVPGVVELMRGGNGAFYNSVTESSWNGNTANDTEWSHSGSGIFQPWQSVFSGGMGSFPSGMKMRVISTGEEFDFVVNSWQSGMGGGFDVSFTPSNCGGSSSGDDWGSQVIQHANGSASSGDGTPSSPLFVGSAGGSSFAYTPRFLDFTQLITQNNQWQLIDLVQHPDLNSIQVNDFKNKTLVIVTEYLKAGAYQSNNYNSGDTVTFGNFDFISLKMGVRSTGDGSANAYSTLVGSTTTHLINCDANGTFEAFRENFNESDLSKRFFIVGILG